MITNRNSESKKEWCLKTHLYIHQCTNRSKAGGRRFFKFYHALSTEKVKGGGGGRAKRNQATFSPSIWGSLHVEHSWPKNYQYILSRLTDFFCKIDELGPLWLTKPYSTYSSWYHSIWKDSGKNSYNRINPIWQQPLFFFLHSIRARNR